MRLDVTPLAPANEARADFHAPRQDIPALTGLRFLAAFSVAIAHTSLLIFRLEPKTLFNHWVSTAAGFGMTLFFVLSGFVIHYNYRQAVTSGGATGLIGFVWARFARLYPLYIFFVISDVLFGRRLFSLLLGDVSGLTDVLQALPFYFLLVQSWIYQIYDHQSLIYVVGVSSGLSWSISTEWFFYLSYPIIALVLMRVRTARWAAITLLVWAVVWMTFARFVDGGSLQADTWATRHFGHNATMVAGYQDSFVRWLNYFSPYLRVGEFIFGCVVAHLYILLQSRDVRYWEHCLGMFVSAVAVISVPVIVYMTYAASLNGGFFFSLRSNFGLAPSCAVLIFCASRYRNALTYVLTRPAIVALGEASYSIYFVHFIIPWAISSFIGQPLPPTPPSIIFQSARWAFTLVTIIIVALGFHAYYEGSSLFYVGRFNGSLPAMR